MKRSKTYLVHEHKCTKHGNVHNRYPLGISQVKERPVNRNHPYYSQNKRRHLRQAPKTADKKTGYCVVFKRWVHTLAAEVCYDAKVYIGRDTEVEDVKDWVTVGKQVRACY